MPDLRQRREHPQSEQYVRESEIALGGERYTKRDENARGENVARRADGLQ